LEITSLAPLHFTIDGFFSLATTFQFNEEIIQPPVCYAKRSDILFISVQERTTRRNGRERA